MAIKKKAPRRAAQKLRADLRQIQAQHALGLDEQRPAAVAKRHQRGQRTARENVAALCDAGSFIEYGPLAIAAQRSRRALDDLQQNTPADGLVCGLGRINSAQVGVERASAVVLAYDYTVLAGTQGFQNHRKTDRLLRLAAERQLPVIFLTEGGGGRPGDVDVGLINSSGLEVSTFAEFAGLSGQVPLIAVNAGRCFAGNALLFGCADIRIATRDSNIGMGGPAMIEGGGLGRFSPDEIGPAPLHAANGVIDILTANEAEAVAAAARVLSYFQGPTAAAEPTDAGVLRELVPENRRMTYEVRKVISALADPDSVQELGAEHAPNMVTALIRVAGRPVGVLANNPARLAGAIDSPAARKAARFMRLCDAHGLPLLSLCDTPGIMVGPDAEATGTVEHAATMFIAGARVRSPWFAVVLRKAYGLGAQAMLGGHLKRPDFTVAWPTGEFGAMGLEGAVALGFRKELEAITDDDKRQQRYEKLLAALYERGKAASVAQLYEIDDVIDPADTRQWLIQGLQAAAARS